MPLVQTRGAASAQGFGEFAQAAVAANYIEEVFSTFLYSSTGTSPSAIVNGIDLAGKGGLVIGKVRNTVDGMGWVDTVRGGSNYLQSDVTNEQFNTSAYSFNNNGYSLQSTNFLNFGTAGQYNFCSWTFRKQPKFFDVVTYTGTGAVQTIAHSLGSVPGCIIVKRTNTSSNWRVYHRSLTSAAYMVELNTTAGQAVENGAWNSTAPTSSVFTVGSASEVNASGSTYVAYVFAHDSAGFGLLGTDNVISCGSYTGTGSPLAVTLGYEPQWVMIKESSASGNDWLMFDNMRGMFVGSNDAVLRANTSAAEGGGEYITPTATGFILGTAPAGINDSGFTYIYIAIRRGPMKVPTSGTSVFSPIVRTGTGAAATVSTTNLTDMSLIINKNRSSNTYNIVSDRLRGPANTTNGSYNLTTNDTVAEYLPALATVTGFNNNNVTLGTNDGVNGNGDAYVNYFFSRAPSFFDEVCYTGTGSATTQTHNLGAVPELMIMKRRSGLAGWPVYAASLGPSSGPRLNGTNATFWGGSSNLNSTAPTSSVFTVGSDTDTNASGSTYVAYLFATCAGVSKVGSYTGNGSSQTINCGFTGGARFVIIKATSTTGNWIVADSARGIVAGNDPALYLNSTAAEVTGLDWIDADNSGFVVNETATIAANTNGVSYIFLAIA